MFSKFAHSFYDNLCNKNRYDTSSTGNCTITVSMLKRIEKKKKQTKNRSQYTKKIILYLNIVSNSHHLYCNTTILIPLSDHRVLCIQQKTQHVVDEFLNPSWRYLPVLESWKPDRPRAEHRTTGRVASTAFTNLFESFRRPFIRVIKYRAETVYGRFVFVFVITAGDLVTLRSYVKSLPDVCGVMCCFDSQTIIRIILATEIYHNYGDVKCGTDSWYQKRIWRKRYTTWRAGKGSRCYKYVV